MLLSIFNAWLFDSQIVDELFLYIVWCLNNVPNDFFVTWWLSWWAGVHPSVFKIKQWNHLFKLGWLDYNISLICQFQGDKEVFKCRIFSFISRWPFVCCFLRKQNWKILLVEFTFDDVAIFIDLAFNNISVMDNLKFNIKPFSINGVFRWRFEAEIKTRELLFITKNLLGNFRFEKVDAWS